MGSELLCSRVERQITNFRSMDKEVLGKSLLDCNSYPINFSFSPNPLPTLSSPYKKVSLRWNVKNFFRVHNPPSSQIIESELSAHKGSILVCTYWFRYWQATQMPTSPVSNILTWKPTWGKRWYFWCKQVWLDELEEYSDSWRSLPKLSRIETRI